MIIRQEKRRGRQPEAATNAAVLEDTPPTPAAKPTAKRGPGRPKGSIKPKEVIFDLPEGMTDDVMAWACNVAVDGNAVYRWRTGLLAMPEIGRMVMALWEILGEEQFVELMKRVRGTEPPAPKPVPLHQLITESFADGKEVQTQREIRDYVQEVLGEEVDRRTLGAILSRMKADGRIVYLDDNQWGLPTTV